MGGPRTDTGTGTANDAVLPALGAGGPVVSVCVTTRGRGQLLERCLADLAAQEGAPPFELLVCCQGDRAAEAVVRGRFPDAVIGFVESAHPGGARNFLVQRARGELLLFLDDDITFPPTLLATLQELAAAHPSVAVFGGPNLTPPHSSLFQVVQGAVLGSLLATGPIRRRYGRHPETEADERFFTLCNMAVRRSAMLPFPPALVCAEENAVLHELATQLAKMRYSPELFVYHERRAHFFSFVRQMKKYGTGRGQCIVRRPGSCRPAHAAAAVLALWAASLAPVAGLWSPWYLLSAAAYLAMAALAGAGVAASLTSASIPRRLAAGVFGTALVVALQLSYGVGVLGGLHRRSKPPISEWQVLAAPTPTVQLTTNDLA